MSGGDNDPWAMVRVLAVIVVVGGFGLALYTAIVAALNWMAS